MKWKPPQMPRKVELIPENSNDRYGKFVVEPLERGFGITLGNAIRRVLLSSLQGAAVTAVRFDGVLHEFSTLPGVIEDATEIILNLKQMRFKLHGDGPKKGLFEAREKGELRAGDLQIDSDVEILNPDLHIATLNSEGDLRMEVEIDAGRGYVAADQHEEAERPIGVIPVDSVFSPVLKVNYKVDQARVGQRIDYDKLQVEIWTDGSILPSDALAVSAKILKDHFTMFIHFEEPIEEEQEEEVDEEVIKMREKLDRSVDELELSVRSSNCLRQAEIRTIGDLVQKTESEMLKYRNFGRKSLKEIQDVLVEMGLGLGMDLSQYYGQRKVGAQAGAQGGPPLMTSSDAYSSEMSAAGEGGIATTRSIMPPPVTEGGTYSSDAGYGDSEPEPAEVASEEDAAEEPAPEATAEATPESEPEEDEEKSL